MTRAVAAWEAEDLRTNAPAVVDRFLEAAARFKSSPKVTDEFLNAIGLDPVVDAYCFANWRLL